MVRDAQMLQAAHHDSRQHGGSHAEPLLWVVKRRVLHLNSHPESAKSCTADKSRPQLSTRTRAAAGQGSLP